MVAHIALPRTMNVGGGAIRQTGTLIRELSAQRPLIVTDSYMMSTGNIDIIAQSLRDNGLKPAVFSGAVPDPTTDSLEQGLQAAQVHRADVLIGVGGGSVIDTAKAMGLLSCQPGNMRDYKAPRNNNGNSVPVVAIPTTAGSGSEATQFTIITDSQNDEKMLCTGRSFLPVASIIDYELTLSMPPRLTADTGIDALTHAVEAYVGRKANPFSDSFALAAIRAIGVNLRRVYVDGADLRAREAMMLAATQAGIAFSNASVALVHGMSRPLGAHFRVSHGLANAMLFPAVTSFSLAAARERYADCARALGVAGNETSDSYAAESFVEELHALNRDLNVPTPHVFGVDRQSWEQKAPLMAEQALTSGSPANNPLVPSAEQIEGLYMKIYA